MRDEFSDQRLPDLPTAGYATIREKQLTDEIMNYIRAAERDRLNLIDTVCQGRERFRRIIKKAWKHLRANDELADAVFGYLVLLAGPNPQEQRDTLLQLDAARKAGLWLPKN